MQKSRVGKYFYSQWQYLLLVAPAMILLLIFAYAPMFGLILSFKDMTPGQTIFNAPWVGFDWFFAFFKSPYFWRSLKNTLVISSVTLVVSFPIPVVFAVMLNEVRNKAFKKTAQSISYFPYFISTVIIVQILMNFLGVDNGLVNNLRDMAGLDRINFFTTEEWFLPLYIITDIWKGLGWSAVIYLAAFTSIDPTLFEAAKIDGANRLKQLWHISLPGISGTIMILLLLSIGNILNIGYEKILLMYNPAIYNVSDVISTYVYREGIINYRVGYATAIGFFNQLCSFVILVSSNKIARKFSGESLW